MKWISDVSAKAYIHETNRDGEKNWSKKRIITAEHVHNSNIEEPFQWMHFVAWVI